MVGATGSLCSAKSVKVPCRKAAKVFKRLPAQGVHPVILRGGLPNGDHHLIDFFHTGRVIKLRLNELHCVPIVKAKGIGVGLLLWHVLKEVRIFRASWCFSYCGMAARSSSVRNRPWAIMALTRFSTAGHFSSTLA